MNKDVPAKVDYWTNNAGMVTEQIGENQRNYHCSDGISGAATIKHGPHLGR